jgi:1,4-alpha-glucan branching enzyme
MTTLPETISNAIGAGQHADPFGVLGPRLITLNDHGDSRAVVIRAFLPTAHSVSVIGLTQARGTTRRADPKPMEKIHEAGLFELVFADRKRIFPYRLLVVSDDGAEREVADPYAFAPLLTEFDRHLIGEGTHYRTYEKLGAHIREVNGVRGTHFAVWAPNAVRVSVIGPFNRWDGRAHVMRLHADAGVWEIFLPAVVEGTPYKYEVLVPAAKGKLDKADPYGFAAELRPNNASIVYDLDQYQWNDAEWMQQRAQHQSLDAPIAIYEVHLGSWKRANDVNHFDNDSTLSLSKGAVVGQRILRQAQDANLFNYRELAHELVAYVKQLGYTHIQLLPIAEYPYDGSWGYQVVGYYAPTSRYGTPTDCMYFVDYCHQNGIGVILDWVPAHFPKDAHGLNYFDGTHLYEYDDPRLREHRDWGTLVFDYGRNEVRNFLISNALFWLDKYHVDGLRVDAVASMLYLDYSREAGQWLPNKYGGRENLEAVSLLKQFNELVHQEYPSAITIAEESTAWLLVSRPTYVGGLGFDFKWNMGWMHDMLKYMSMDPLFRRNHHNSITFSLWYAFNENYILPLSHDEVVHLKKSLLEKMPGDEWKKFASLRAFYGYMIAHPGKKLMFMGDEFGQRREWSESRGLDWGLLELPFHRQLQQFVADLNRLYRAEPSLHEVDFTSDGFQWIDFHDVEQSVISFLRFAKNKDNFLVVVCNFTPVPRFGYRVGVPVLGKYQELINSDSEYYGGSNLGNGVGADAEETAWQSQLYSVVLTLPPLATVVLRCVERREKGEGSGKQQESEGDAPEGVRKVLIS